MFAWIRRRLTAPIFADEEKTRAAGLLYSVSLVIAAVTALLLSTLLVVYGLPRPTDLFGWSVIGAILSLFATSVGLLVLVHLGQVRFAGAFLTTLFWLLVSFAVFGFDGLRSVDIAGYPIVIALAGLLLGGRGALVYTGLSTLAVIGVFFAELLGILVYPPPVLEPFDLIGAVGAMILIGLLLRYAVGSINAGFDRARRNAAALAEGNRELQAARASLEQSVSSLQRRSTYMEASAEVSRAAAAILEPDALISQMVDLIRERFGLYYVGLFLLDETGEWAVLRAGTGPAGQSMLARRHRIRVGEGMIGWSVAHGEARVASDVGADVVRLATPELPNTRSEAALPLRSRGRVLGALTVQSDQPEAFDQEALIVLQTMADQMAVALDNARLFVASQQALEAERRAYGEISQAAWQEMIRGWPDLRQGYVCGAQGPAQAIQRPWPTEMVQAGQTAQVVQADDRAVAVPIKIRDRVAGVVRLRKPDLAGAWTPEEIALMETLADQLGVALESARLYQDTQRRAAQERLLGEVTARMRETLDMDTVLQTAVHEISQALGLAALDLRLGVDLKSDPSAVASSEE